MMLTLYNPTHYLLRSHHLAQVHSSSPQSSRLVIFTNLWRLNKKIVETARRHDPILGPSASIHILRQRNSGDWGKLALILARRSIISMPSLSKARSPRPKPSKVIVGPNHKGRMERVAKGV